MAGSIYREEMFVTSKKVIVEKLAPRRTMKCSRKSALYSTAVYLFMPCRYLIGDGVVDKLTPSNFSSMIQIDSSATSTCVMESVLLEVELSYKYNHGSGIDSTK